MYLKRRIKSDKNLFSMLEKCIHLNDFQTDIIALQCSFLCRVRFVKEVHKTLPFSLIRVSSLLLKNLSLFLFIPKFRRHHAFLNFLISVLKNHITAVKTKMAKLDDGDVDEIVNTVTTATTATTVSSVPAELDTFDVENVTRTVLTVGVNRIEATLVLVMRVSEKMVERQVMTRVMNQSMSWNLMSVLIVK